MTSVAWLANQPELLHVVLELAETWDDDDDSSTALTDSSGEDFDERPPEHPRLPALNVKTLSPNVGGERPVKAATEASTHHRRRKEILYLRDKVENLEQELSKLQLKAKKRKFEEPRPGDALVAVWKEAARWQQKLRDESEMNQGKLRCLLETQVQVARGLLRLLEQARQQEALKIANDGQSRSKPENSFVQETDQLTVIDRCYENLEDEFSFHKFHDGSAKFVDVNVSGHERGHDRRPRCMDGLVPAIARRERLVGVHYQRGQRDLATAAPPPYDGRVLVSHLKARTSLGDFKCDYCGQVIAKRFPAPNPAVITTVYSMPSVESGDGNSGVYSQSTSCLRAVPVRGHPGLSCIQSSLRLTLMFDRDVGSPWRHHSNFVTNIVLGRLGKDIEKKHSAIRALLLQPSPEESGTLIQL